MKESRNSHIETESLLPRKRKEKESSELEKKTSLRREIISINIPYFVPNTKECMHKAIAKLGSIRSVYDAIKNKGTLSLNIGKQSIELKKRKERSKEKQENEITKVKDFPSQGLYNVKKFRHRHTGLIYYKTSFLGEITSTIETEDICDFHYEQEIQRSTDKLIKESKSKKHIAPSFAPTVELNEKNQEINQENLESGQLKYFSKKRFNHPIDARIFEIKNH